MFIRQSEEVVLWVVWLFWTSFTFAAVPVCLFVCKLHWTSDD